MTDVVVLLFAVGAVAWSIGLFRDVVNAGVRPS